MKSLSIDQILDAEDVTVEAVETPAWGGQVYVRTLTGDKRDKIDELFAANGDGNRSLVGVRAKVVAACMCDSEGKFCSLTDSQILALGSKSGAMLDRVFDVCQRINFMRGEDIEKLEKNSPPAGSNGSG